MLSIRYKLLYMSIVNPVTFMVSSNWGLLFGLLTGPLVGKAQNTIASKITQKYKDQIM